MDSKTPPTILMTSPAHYLIPSVENPHMDINNQPDINKAWAQWTVIHNLYQMLDPKIKVFVMESAPERHDMVFAANGAWGKKTDDGKSVCVLSNYRSPLRRPEKEYFKKWLERLGCRVWELPESMYFEGQGDVVTLSDYYLFAHGPRSSPESRDYIQNLLGLDREIVSLKLVNENFYHLDTCLMSLRGTGEEGLIYAESAFGVEDQEKLADLNVKHKFEIRSRALANAFVCNSVFINDTVLLNVPYTYSAESFELTASATPLRDSRSDPRWHEIMLTCADYNDLVRFLWEIGYNVIPVYTSEYYKSGAGIRCLTLFVD